jgi:hypothetical protein
MAPLGSFIQGVALSAVGAVLAGVIWVVIALATGFIIGYVGILIGIAAGSGMHIGQKGYSKNGGIIAAGMTLAAILMAKLAVVQIYLAQHHSNASVFDLDASRLAFYLFTPISLLIMVISMGAAFRTASGSVKT